jgi:peptidoglycan/xylan/chitin deacetylase (PgdA/CDA1 family)
MDPERGQENPDNRGRNARTGGRRPRRTRAGLAAAALLIGQGLTVATAPTAHSATTTVVSLTFDDGYADQMSAVSILNEHGIKGTFYIISGSIGTSDYLTEADLQSMAGSGHEIGGHTVTHPDLTTLPVDEARREICTSRASLSSWGHRITSFAYPYSAYNAEVEQLVGQCGYNSARTLGDIASAHGCTGCPTAGTIPPADPYNIRAPDDHDNTWTLSDMQDVVTTAERTGGWLPFTFHRICDNNCDRLSISTSMLDSFVSWLGTRSDRGTVVKTVDQVIGGPVRPVVTASPLAHG